MADKSAKFKWWRELSPDQRAKHEKLIKIYNVSPFLYSQICQRDNWIRYAHQVGLLPSQSVGIPNSGPVTKHLFEKVCLMEECNDLVVAEMTKSGCLEAVDKVLVTISAVTPVNEVVKKGGSSSVIKRWREKISCKQTPTVYVALMFVSSEYVDHVMKFVNCNPEDEFDYLCDLCDEKVLKEKKKGNLEFQQEKYGSALSSYTNGLCRSLYNYVLYGNRALAYLKLGKYWEAMSDGWRCVILKPDWPKGQYRYAEAWYKLGKLAKAIEVVQAAVEINPTDRDLLGQKERFLAERQRKKRQSSKGGKVASKGSGLEKKSTSCQTEPACIMRVDKRKSVSGGTKTGVNAADSDSDDLPSLVSASDDDDSDSDDDCDSLPPVRTKSAKNTTETERLNGVRKNVQKLLRRGSEALLQQHPVRAAREYLQAMVVLKKLSSWSVVMKELDYVVLLYAIGTAYFDMHTLKDFLEGLSWYGNILKQHENVSFPLVYLGFGQAYYEGNWYTEALETLQEGLDEDQWQDALINWPGTKTMIAESRTPLLKAAIVALIRQCRQPPPPTAICKYEECEHYNLAIYLNDMDFKGYVAVHCLDHCVVAYHPDCWKDVKKKLRTTDKEILQGQCFTPDCGSYIKDISNYDEASVLHKRVNEKPVLVEKEKKKIIKMKPSSQRKIARKRDKQAVRRQKKQEAREERDKPTVSTEETTESKKEVKDTITDSAHSKTAVTASGDAASDKPKAIIAVLHHGPGGDAGEDGDLYVGSRSMYKPKNKKKKGGPKAAKVTMSLEEFVGDADTNGVTESGASMCLNAFDDDLYSFVPPCETEVKESIFSVVVDIIRRRGPTHIVDVALQRELQTLPEGIRRMIERAGGLSKFLLESRELEVVDRVVCLTDLSVSMIPNLKTDFPSLQNNAQATVPDVGVRNGVTSSKRSYDVESVSSEGSYFSSTSGTRVVSSTAQLAPIQLDREPKNNTTYVAQETWRGETEKACGMTENPVECFAPDKPASSTMWYSDDYDHGYDRERLDDDGFDRERPEHDGYDRKMLDDGGYDRKMLDDDGYDRERPDHDGYDRKILDDPEDDDLSPDEYEFLRRNREFVPSPEASRVTTDDECEDTDLVTRSGHPESVASLATFSEYDRVTPPSVQATYGLHDFLGQCQEVVGLNGDTDTTINTQNGVAPVVSAADKTYILELEDRQEELKDIIIKERDDCARLQRETDERINTLQMDAAKSMSVSDEHINSLHRDYGRLKQASDATIANLFADVKNLKHEIQEKVLAATEFEAARVTWQKEKASLTNEMQSLMALLDNAKLTEERTADVMKEKDKMVASLKSDVARERELQSSKENELCAIETRRAVAVFRAQDSEVELLKLKLDVGMQILCRSEADASRVKHMIATQRKEMAGKNPAMCPQMGLAVTQWEATIRELSKMKVDTENTFKDQIAKVQGGQPLSELPMVPIPKPPHPPKIPMLPPHRMQPEAPVRLPTPPTKNNVESSGAPTLPGLSSLSGTPQGGATATSTVAVPAQPSASPQKPLAPPAAVKPGQPLAPPPLVKPGQPLAPPPLVKPGQPLAPPPLVKPSQPLAPPPAVRPGQSQAPPPLVKAGQPSAPPPTVAVRPGQPLTSKDKILHQLHAIYPTFSKLQFKGYIDELRGRNQGSLSGMKIEDIVKGVTVIIQGGNPEVGGCRASPLDTFALPSAFVYDEEVDPCIICHDELDTQPVCKLGCNHRFHKKCIDQWMQKHNTCPTCRERTHQRSRPMRQ